MKTQRELFDSIAVRFKSRTDMYNFVAEKLCVSVDTITKCSYGNIGLSYERLQKLVKLFNLQPQDLFLAHPERLHFDHIPLDMQEIEDYYRYISGFAQRLAQAVEAPDVAINFHADEVPIFHFMPYTRLTYFKLYAYAYDKLKLDLKYEEFVEQLQPYNLEPLFEQISCCYDRIPSIEVWDNHVLDTLLFQIEHFEILERYHDPQAKMDILDDLLHMIEKFRIMATNGFKESGVRFDFFRKEMPIRMGYMLLLSNTYKSLSIKIDTINNISTIEPYMVDSFCYSFKASVDKSTALGIGAERDRIIYFKELTRKIEEAQQIDKLS